MALPRELTTERLLLRRWLPSDRRPFAQLNADPRVMEYFPAPLTRDESNRMVQRIEAQFERHGFGLWALEVPGVVDFAGFVGLLIPSFEAPFTPCVEIGWRLPFEHWGKGYAPEAARAVLRFAFERAGLHEVLSFTATCNTRSRRVMEKIGMRYDAADEFDHPNLPRGHRLERHALYRIRADELEASSARC
ncbi:MAG: GNAT family N-acetyltransferase [Polyangiaceae bacterium]